MNIQEDRGKIKTNQGWLMCPACGKHKVLKLRPDTEAKNLTVHCKRCGAESVVNILPGVVPVP